MVRKILSYYICQLAGWGLILAGVFLIPFSEVGILGMEVLAGLVTSHLLRVVIIRAGWLELPIGRNWLQMAVAVLLACVVAAGIKLGCCSWLMEREPSGSRFVLALFEYLLLLLPWTGIYLFYHHIQRSRRQCVRNKDLKLRVVAMQQHCEESGTDMEGMMATLQRIAVLIETDPDKSREEITAFGKLLRSGYMRG